MIWSIIFTLILVGASIKIHGLALAYLSRIKVKKFVYCDFAKISFVLIASHLIQICLFAIYYQYIFELYPNMNFFEGKLEGTFLDFFYYSANCYTTLGTGDIFVNGPLRITTGLEALIGLVLIAWTATFKLGYLFKNKN